jgi:uncharacterized protein YqfB (UPF0267 family)
MKQIVNRDYPNIEPVFETKEPDNGTPKRAIHFSYNWNRKLGCIAFTTIRIYQPEKYVVGEEYEIYEKKTFAGYATIKEVKTFYLNQINEFMAMLDTGYPVKECKEVIKSMYPKANFETTLLSMILLVKRKNERSKMKTKNIIEIMEESEIKNQKSEVK